MTAAGRAPVRRRLRVPRPGPRGLLAVVAVVIALGGLYWWLRDSSLVAVQKVRITGVSGPDAGRIRGALRTAARSMTTLDVKMDQLRTAVAPYSVVKRLDVSTSLPHELIIHVLEQVPVALVSAGGRRSAVSADGTLLPASTVTAPLPTIQLRVPPGGTRLTGSARDEVRLVAAAPYRILARLGVVSSDPAHGLTATLRNGPAVYFGSAQALREKWNAVVAVLGAPGSAGAVYIDVTVPARPAAGAGSDTATTGSAGAGTAPAGTASTPSGTAGTAPAAGGSSGAGGTSTSG